MKNIKQNLTCLSYHKILNMTNIASNSVMHTSFNYSKTVFNFRTGYHYMTNSTV